MAAKRKGGLKLNAICAKLSRQVVFDSSSQNAEGDQSVADNSERGSSHYDDSETNFPESLTQSLEEDQRRREAIEKWVNGEYGDEPAAPDDEQESELKASTDEDVPPEGVYMVQPKGCSDDEEEAGSVTVSQDGSFQDNKDADDKTSKDDAYVPPSESRQASFSSPGTLSWSPGTHSSPPRLSRSSTSQCGATCHHTSDPWRQEGTQKVIGFNPHDR